MPEIYNGGWIPNPEGVRGVLSSLPHPGVLSQAAPGIMGDGMTGDHLSYLAYYETPDDWGGAEPPPYLPQPGYNCTSEGTARGVDLLQIMEAAKLIQEGRKPAPFFRSCIEAIYAFGLFKAGMRGDKGCYGAAMAKAVYEIGVVSYRDVDGVDEVSRDRLIQYSDNPEAVVRKYQDVASKTKVGEIVLIETWEDYCAWIANQGVVILSSSVGYETPRDNRGICRRHKRWNHLMLGCGVLRSDGVETGVIKNSWGQGNPTGPRPFKLPGDSFRALKEDIQAQLSQRDSWGLRLFPGFAPAPLPERWTNLGWY